MKINGLFFRLFKHVDTPETLRVLLKRIGIELTEEESENYLNAINIQKEGLDPAQLEPKELSEEDLAAIAGGKGGDTGYSHNPNDYIGRMCEDHGEVGQIINAYWANDICGRPTFFLDIRMSKTGRIKQSEPKYITFLSDAVPIQIH